MERTAELDLGNWQSKRIASDRRTHAGVFASAVIGCAFVSALMASWVPLQFSIVTVFLFAGPHNWFELRYFLMRLPVRFGKSRNFFLIAFAGIGLLTLTYVALPVLYGLNFQANWSMVLATWNTSLLLWLAVLVWMRGKQKARRDWSWAIPVACALSSINWLRPELFSLAIVFLHPLIALWFLDRHLRRTRPEWLPTYHRCLLLVPLLVGGMIWQLSQTQRLADDNGLFWRITQHAGAELLPGISSHLLVSVHVFLEMLHYAVWLVALPLIAPAIIRSSGSVAPPRKIWDLQSVPLARHPLGFPKLVGVALVSGLMMLFGLWFGFSMDYSTTRDIYFTVAIAHVLAEAPFLLRMI